MKNDENCTFVAMCVCAFVFYFPFSFLFPSGWDGNVINFEIYVDFTALICCELTVWLIQDGNSDLL